MIRTHPLTHETPHGGQARDLPRATVPKAPPELLAIQRKIKRTTGELVPMATLDLALNGGQPSLSTPKLAAELIAALPQVTRNRKRLASVRATECQVTP